MSIPLDTPTGTTFWGMEWGNPFCAQVALVSKENVAYRNDDKIQTISQDRAFLTQAEVLQAAISHHEAEATASHKQAAHFKQLLQDAPKETP